jgi:hypothetical protein
LYGAILAFGKQGGSASEVQYSPNSGSLDKL